MQRVNAAFQDRDLAALRSLTRESEFTDSAFEAKSIGEKLVWAIREVARLDDLHRCHRRRTCRRPRERHLYALARQQDGEPVIDAISADITSELSRKRDLLAELIATYRQAVESHQVEWRSCTREVHAVAGLAFDPRMPSPMVRRGVDRLNALVAASGDEPRLLWSFNGCAHQTDRYGIRRVVSMLDGVVLVECWNRDFRFLDSETGRERWSWQRARMADTGDRIVVTTDEMGNSIASAIVDGDLVARDLQTGEPDGGSPLPSRRKRFASARGRPHKCPEECLTMYSSDDAQRLVAIDQYTGRPLWSIDFSLNGSVIQLEDVVFVADEHVLSCIDPVTGKDSWTAQVDGQLVSISASNGSRVSSPC